MIILVGASASGKTVTALMLQKKYGLTKAITTTTRAVRKGERDGVDYFFVTREEFLKRNAEGKFVENTLYNNNFYGCGVEQVADDKIIVLDPNGVNAFRKLKNDHIVIFFIKCSEEKRKNRMELRGDNADKIKQRLENDIIDFDKRKVGKVDFVIDTDNLTIEQACDLIYENYINKIKNIEK